MTWQWILLSGGIGLLVGYFVGFFDGAHVARKIRRALDERLS